MANIERKVNLLKSVFGKTEYLKTIDTSFKELGVNTVAQEIEAQPNIEEFFSMYNTLFYDIPAEGTTNSHQFLVEQSGEYINFEDNIEEIQALRAEIANLRRENLNLQVNNLKDLGGEGIEEDVAKLEAQIQAVNDQTAEAANKIQTTANSLNTTLLPEANKNTSAVGYFDS
jgi:hypothetical protein